VFFGARLIGPALAVIAALLAAILANAFLFWRIDRVAGALLVPYAAWVSFATLLNAALWRLN
jgi:benzodiazapine receptor